MKPRFAVVILALLICLLMPAQAEAHLLNTGVGPFYDGITHPFANPLDLLLIAITSILAGFGGPVCARRTSIGLTIGWGIGLVSGLSGLDLNLASQVVPALLIMSLSLLVVLGIHLPTIVLAPIALLLGIWFGNPNGLEFGDVSDGNLASFGVAVCVLLLATSFSALTVKYPDGWQRVVFRVCGSWIAAVCLLIIGWQFRA